MNAVRWRVVVMNASLVSILAQDWRSPKFGHSPSHKFGVTEPNCWHPGLLKPGGKPLDIALESSSYCCISPISAASHQKLMLVVGGWWHTA